MTARTPILSASRVAAAACIFFVTKSGPAATLLGEALFALTERGRERGPFRMPRIHPKPDALAILAGRLPREERLLL